ncbi:hypothetical protein KAR04_05640 [Candidatus Calescamantes bacterium]|nr:hypothetical protein [Candidatus Calescamantes bacterium]
MTERSMKQRQRISGAWDLKQAILTKAHDLLTEMELEHQRGEDWVHLDEAPAAAVNVLKNLDMITVIKIDGCHRGQIKGAIK